MKVEATKITALIAGSWSAFGLTLSGRLGCYGPSCGWKATAVVMIFIVVPLIVWVVGIDDRSRRWSQAHRSGKRGHGGGIRAMRQSIRARLGWHFTKEAWQKWPVIWLRMLLWFLGVVLTAPVLYWLFGLAGR